MKRLLEIESKFRFRESLLPRFRANQGNPPFQRLAFIRTHKFEDIYYDRGDVLCKNGLWIRERIDHDSKSRVRNLILFLFLSLSFCAVFFSVFFLSLSLHIFSFRIIDFLLPSCPN